MTDPSCSKCREFETLFTVFQAFFVAYMFREGISEIRVSQKDMPDNNGNPISFQFFPDKNTGDLVCRVDFAPHEGCPSCSSGKAATSH